MDTELSILASMVSKGLRRPITGSLVELYLEARRSSHRRGLTAAAPAAADFRRPRSPRPVKIYDLNHCHSDWLCVADAVYGALPLVPVVRDAVAACEPLALTPAYKGALVVTNCLNHSLQTLSLPVKVRSPLPI